MIRDTNPYSVSQIFTNDKPIYYIIPKYQREYTWGKREWIALFDDVISNDNGYFLGSIICVNVSKSSLGATVLEVIDGQQRITSLSILLATLYEKIEKHKELDQELSHELYNLRKELVLTLGKRKKKQPRLTPQIQNNNQDDYFSLLSGIGLLDNYQKKNNAGNRRIYRAYYYFSKLIDDYLEELKAAENTEYDEVTELFDLVDKFNSAIIVSIEVETHKDAYMLFESLNNRGIPLSSIDLIKNIIISQSDADDRSDECYEQWKIILKYLGDDYSNQERFFRYYYDAYREELNEGFPVSGRQKYYLGYVATRSNLLDIYETLIKKDYQSFLDEIQEKAGIYGILTNNNADEPIYQELRDSLLNLERIQGAPSYILLLYLMSERNQLELSIDHFKDIISYLTTFFVRRNITDFPSTRNLPRIFMDIIGITKQKKGQAIVDATKEYLKANISSDEEFERRLRGDIYLDNPDATRFLLCYYENQFKTNEIYTDLWIRDNKRYKWTIEHIFPEGNNIPKEWIDMIAEGNEELAKEYLLKYTHTLGNLTISGYNQNLSNMSFERKKERVNNKGLKIGYRNGLKLNDDVVNEDSWTVEHIKKRTDKLVNYFVSEFNL